MFTIVLVTGSGAKCPRKAYYTLLKGGAYVINLYEFKSRGTNWINLYMNENNIVYFHSFGVEHIPKEIKNS